MNKNNMGDISDVVFESYSKKFKEKSTKIIENYCLDRVFSLNNQKGSNGRFSSMIKETGLERIVVSFSTISKNFLSKTLRCIYEWKMHFEKDELHDETTKFIDQTFETKLFKRNKQFTTTKLIYEARKLGGNYVFCYTILGIISTFSEPQPKEEKENISTKLSREFAKSELFQKIEKMCLNYFKAEINLPSFKNSSIMSVRELEIEKKAVSNMYAKIIGILAKIRFEEVIKNAITYSINVLNDKKEKNTRKRAAGIIRGMRSIELDISTKKNLLRVNECLNRMYNLYKEKGKRKTISQAFCESLSQVFSSISHQSIKNGLDYSSFHEMMKKIFVLAKSNKNSKDKFFYPMLCSTIALCSKKYFIANWWGLMETLLKHYQDKKKKTKTVYLGCIIHLIQHYLIISKEKELKISKSMVFEKLEKLANGIFTSTGSKKITMNEPQYIGISDLIVIIANSYTEYAMEKFVLFSLQEPNAIVSDNTIIGMISFLALAEQCDINKIIRKLHSDRIEMDKVPEWVENLLQKSNRLSVRSRDFEYSKILNSPFSGFSSITNDVSMVFEGSDIIYKRYDVSGLDLQKILKFSEDLRKALERILIYCNNIVGNGPFLECASLGSLKPNWKDKNDSILTVFSYAIKCIPRLLPVSCRGSSTSPKNSSSLDIVLLLSKCNIHKDQRIQSNAWEVSLEILDFETFPRNILIGGFAKMILELDIEFPSFSLVKILTKFITLLSRWLNILASNSSPSNLKRKYPSPTVFRSLKKEVKSLPKEAIRPSIESIVVEDIVGLTCLCHTDLKIRLMSLKIFKIFRQIYEYLSVPHSPKKPTRLTPSSLGTKKRPKSIKKPSTTVTGGLRTSVSLKGIRKIHVTSIQSLIKEYGNELIKEINSKKTFLNLEEFLQFCSIDQLSLFLNKFGKLISKTCQTTSYYALSHFCKRILHINSNFEVNYKDKDKEKLQKRKFLKMFRIWKLLLSFSVSLSVKLKEIPSKKEKNQKNNSSNNDNNNGEGREGVKIHELFNSILPYIKSNSELQKETIIDILGSVNSNLLILFFESLKPYQEEYLKKKKKLSLRITISRIFSLLSKSILKDSFKQRKIKDKFESFLLNTLEFIEKSVKTPELQELEHNFFITIENVSQKCYFSKTALGVSLREYLIKFIIKYTSSLSMSSGGGGGGLFSYEKDEMAIANALNKQSSMSVKEKKRFSTTLNTPRSLGSIGGSYSSSPSSLNGVNRLLETQACLAISSLFLGKIFSSNDEKKIMSQIFQSPSPTFISKKGKDDLPSEKNRGKDQSSRDGSDEVFLGKLIFNWCNSMIVSGDLQKKKIAQSVLESILDHHINLVEFYLDQCYRQKEAVVSDCYFIAFIRVFKKTPQFLSYSTDSNLTNGNGRSNKKIINVISLISIIIYQCISSSKLTRNFALSILPRIITFSSHAKFFLSSGLDEFYDQQFQLICHELSYKYQELSKLVILYLSKRLKFVSKMKQRKILTSFKYWLKFIKINDEAETESEDGSEGEKEEKIKKDEKIEDIEKKRKDNEIFFNVLFELTNIYGEEFPEEIKTVWITLADSYETNINESILYLIEKAMFSLNLNLIKSINSSSPSSSSSSGFNSPLNSNFHHYKKDEEEKWNDEIKKYHTCQRIVSYCSIIDPKKTMKSFISILVNNRDQKKSNGHESTKMGKGKGKKSSMSLKKKKNKSEKVMKEEKKKKKIFQNEYNSYSSSIVIVLMVEMMYKYSNLFNDYIPLIIQSCLLRLDHPNYLIQSSAKQIIMNIIYCSISQDLKLFVFDELKKFEVCKSLFKSLSNKNQTLFVSPELLWEEEKYDSEEDEESKDKEKGKLGGQMNGERKAQFDKDRSSDGKSKSLKLEATKEKEKSPRRKLTTSMVIAAKRKDGGTSRGRGIKDNSFFDPLSLNSDMYEEKENEKIEESKGMMMNETFFEFLEGIKELFSNSFDSFLEDFGTELLVWANHSNSFHHVIRSCQFYCIINPKFTYSKLLLLLKLIDSQLDKYYQLRSFWKKRRKKIQKGKGRDGRQGGMVSKKGKNEGMGGRQKTFGEEKIKNELEEEKRKIINILNQCFQILQKIIDTNSYQLLIMFPQLIWISLSFLQSNSFELYRFGLHLFYTIIKNPKFHSSLKEIKQGGSILSFFLFSFQPLFSSSSSSVGGNSYSSSSISSTVSSGTRTLMELQIINSEVIRYLIFKGLNFSSTEKITIKILYRLIPITFFQPQEYLDCYYPSSLSSLLFFIKILTLLPSLCLYLETSTSSNSYSKTDEKLMKSIVSELILLCRSNNHLVISQIFQGVLNHSFKSVEKFLVTLRSSKEMKKYIGKYNGIIFNFLKFCLQMNNVKFKPIVLKMFHTFMADDLVYFPPEKKKGSSSKGIGGISSLKGKEGNGIGGKDRDVSDDEFLEKLINCHPIFNDDSTHVLDVMMKNKKNAKHIKMIERKSKTINTKLIRKTLRQFSVSGGGPGTIGLVGGREGDGIEEREREKDTGTKKTIKMINKLMNLTKKTKLKGKKWKKTKIDYEQEIQTLEKSIEFDDVDMNQQLQGLRYDLNGEKKEIDENNENLFTLNEVNRYTNEFESYLLESIETGNLKNVKTNVLFEE